MSSVCSSAERTASTVVGLMSCPPSTRSASSSTTARACSTWGASRDLRHHVRHDAAEVAHARRADLCDRVVDDLLELVLGERLGHELLEHCQLSLFSKRLLLAATAPEGLRRVEPALALALEHL